MLGKPSPVILLKGDEPMMAKMMSLPAKPLALVLVLLCATVYSFYLGLGAASTAASASTVSPSATLPASAVSPQGTSAPPATWPGSAAQPVDVQQPKQTPAVPAPAPSYAQFAARMAVENGKVVAQQAHEAKMKQVTLESQLVTKERSLEKGLERSLKAEEKQLKEEEKVQALEDAALQRHDPKAWHKLAKEQLKLQHRVQKSARKAQKVVGSDLKNKAIIDGLGIQRWKPQKSAEHDRTQKVRHELERKEAGLKRRMRELDERQRRALKRQSQLGKEASEGLLRGP